MTSRNISVGITETWLSSLLHWLHTLHKSQGFRSGDLAGQANGKVHEMARSSAKIILESTSSSAESHILHHAVCKVASPCMNTVAAKKPLCLNAGTT